MFKVGDKISYHFEKKILIGTIVNIVIDEWYSQGIKRYTILWPDGMYSAKGGFSDDGKLFHYSEPNDVLKGML